MRGEPVTPRLGQLASVSRASESGCRGSRHRRKSARQPQATCVFPAWHCLRQGAQCRCGIPPGACSCVPPKNGRLTGEILFRWLTARPGNLMSGRSPVKARTTAVQVNRSSDVLPPSVNGGRIRNRQCSRRAFRNHGSASNCVELRAQIHCPRHIPRPPLFGKMSWS